MTNRDLWLAVLDRLKPTIQKTSFLTWFQHTGVVERSESTVVVGVPNEFTAQNLSKKYDEKIAAAVVAVDAALTDIQYRVAPGLGGTKESVDVRELFKNEEKVVRKVRNKNEVKVKTDGGVQISKMLNDRYSLNSFIVGTENRLPHAVCSAVGDQPGGVYNPLFIYGNVGLGKTHLLQAAGQKILSNYPDMVVKYITAERFVSEIVAAMRSGKAAKFKQEYRNVDALLVDDVQFFARKQASQDEFFHTFNELHDLNKQIIVTSDRAPSELKILDDRLASRLMMGMVVELKMPEYETRLAILQQKCQDFGIIMDPEVLEFIANNIQNNVRELEGVLRQAVATCELENRVPTIRDAAEIIKRLNKAQEIIGYDIEAKQMQRMARTAEDVMELVADHFELKVDDLTGKDRHKEIMIPRQICMYLIKMELGHSYEKIGECFGGRNHTTVMHACNKTASTLKKDVRMVKVVNALKRDMGL